MSATFTALRTWSYHSFVQEKEEHYLSVHLDRFPVEKDEWVSACAIMRRGLCSDTSPLERGMVHVRDGRDG